jgi:hypothetical protein
LLLILRKTHLSAWSVFTITAEKEPWTAMSLFWLISAISTSAHGR